MVPLPIRRCKTSQMRCWALAIDRAGENWWIFGGEVGTGGLDRRNATGGGRRVIGRDPGRVVNRQLLDSRLSSVAMRPFR